MDEGEAVLAKQQPLLGPASLTPVSRCCCQLNPNRRRSRVGYVTLP